MSDEADSWSPRLIYRAMPRDDDDQPAAVDTGLGVREGIDVKPSPEGLVQPGGRGMSVAPDDPQLLPPRYRPNSLGGTGELPVWAMQRESLPGSLAYVRTSKTHGVVSPSEETLLESYRADLVSTRPEWTVTDE